MPTRADIVSATARTVRPALVAVDGVDGSGKTTYADRLAAAYLRRGRHAVVVHLDDFLNPRKIRYRLGRESAEGYFRDTYDLATFDTQVLAPLRPGGDRVIVPRAFDHRSDMAVTGAPVRLPDHAVVLVEGMFLHREELHAAWDISVFLQVPFAVSVARMARRDGTSRDPDHPSLARYVDGQRLYLARCTPEERATYVIDNS